MRSWDGSWARDASRGRLGREAWIALLFSLWDQSCSGSLAVSEALRSELVCCEYPARASQASDPSKRNRTRASSRSFGLARSGLLASLDRHYWNYSLPIRSSSVLPNCEETPRTFCTRRPHISLPRSYGVIPWPNVVGLGYRRRLFELCISFL